MEQTKTNKTNKNEKANDSNTNIKKQAKHIKSDFKPSPQDTLFLNQISFLNQTSYVNLVELNNIELCRGNHHSIKKLTNKKPIKL